MIDCVTLDSNSTLDIQPTHIKTQLKEHQLALVNYCSKLEKSCINSMSWDDNVDFRTKFGIIGDIVGSGKTLSVLSLISKEPRIKTDLPKIVSNEFCVVKEEYKDDNDNFNNYKYNLIVVPHTIYKQWCNSIETHCDLNYYGIFNAKSLNKFIDTFNDVKQDGSYKKFEENNIILITNTKYNEFCKQRLKFWITYETIFSRIIFDEADSIKIPSCNKLNYSFMWFVTSSYKTLLTPHGRFRYANANGDVQNYYSYEYGYTNRVIQEGIKNNGFIKNTMISITQIQNDYRKYFIVKNIDKFVHDSFKLPDYLTNIIKCKTPLYLKVLNNNVSSEIIKHINAGDISGAIEKINCTKIDGLDLITSVTYDLKEKIRNKIIELEAKEKMSYSSENAKKEAIEKQKFKIKLLENKLESIKEKLDNNCNCSICYDEEDDIDHLTITPCCKSKFCFTCISHCLAIKNECPYCRSKITLDSLIVVAEKTEKDNKVEVLKSKLDNLKEIIEKENNEYMKMLIFSDFSNSFNEIKQFLDEENIKYAQVMGTTNTINSILKNYKNGIIKVLLLNSEFCASGINLENTSDIVLYHSMNKDKTKQVIGRGQRPGRTKALNVWKLCHENEIFE